MSRFLFARPALTLAALTVCMGAAHAGEIYVPLGLPGVGVGYAHPINAHFAVRGDFMTLGSREKTESEEGIEYNGKLKLNRFALLGDWFPFGGRFRLTAGIASTNYKLELDASGAGKQIEVGDNRYTLGANDGLNVQVKFPSTMPYLGLGWGHQTETGLRFSADLGALIGKAKVEATTRGTALSSAQAQQDVAKEVQQLSGGVGKARFIPQISVGIGYSF